MGDETMPMCFGLYRDANFDAANGCAKCPCNTDCNTVALKPDDIEEKTDGRR